MPRRKKRRILIRTYRDLLRSGLFDEIARCFLPGDPRTDQVLVLTDFPSADIPRESPPSRKYWHVICSQIDISGGLDGFHSLLEAAHRILPKNLIFREYVDSTTAGQATGGRVASSGVLPRVQHRAIRVDAIQRPVSLQERPASIEDMRRQTLGLLSVIYRDAVLGIGLPEVRLSGLSDREANEFARTIERGVDGKLHLQPLAILADQMQDLVETSGMGSAEATRAYADAFGSSELAGNLRRLFLARDNTSRPISIEYVVSRWDNWTDYANTCQALEHLQSELGSWPRL